MKNMIAFAKEYGDNSFDFVEHGTHFIVAAVLLSKNKVKEAEQLAEIIREKYFQKGEIKSSDVGSDHGRRINVLAELVRLDFTIYAVVIDKRDLFGEGFKHKGSFYKFINGIVYKELFRTFPDLSLVIDQRETNDFIQSFTHYIENYHINDLFSQTEFQLSHSLHSVLMQVADFVANSLGYCFDELKRNAEGNEIMNLLRSKISGINYFPSQIRNYKPDPAVEDRSYDPVIAQVSVRQAREFIERKVAMSIYDLDQVNCVKLLLLYFSNYDASRYITTKEILKHLEIGREEPLSEHAFRTQVIAKIRDAGVIVASSSSGERKGYKLPCNVKDLHKFVNHGKSMILPMLARIAKSREKILLATNREVDILEGNEFTELKKLLDL